MGFEKPQDYVDALKRLEGFPLMGMEVSDGHLFFTSLSSHVALPFIGRFSTLRWTASSTWTTGYTS